MINQQFVQKNCMDYEFVNREEDAGVSGLRNAKLSYRACAAGGEIYRHVKGASVIP